MTTCSDAQGDHVCVSSTLSEPLAGVRSAHKDIGDILQELTDAALSLRGKVKAVDSDLYTILALVEDRLVSAVEQLGEAATELEEEAPKLTEKIASLKNKRGDLGIALLDMASDALRAENRSEERTDEAKLCEYADLYFGGDCNVTPARAAKWRKRFHVEKQKK